MTNFVETPADCKTASATSGELSEAELSTVTGGAGRKITPAPFVFVHYYDKSSPVLA
jgi:hypothetical protein